MTRSVRNAIWDILVKSAGASERERENFLGSFPHCREYRFIGGLGFGGKVRFDPQAPHRPPYVDYYMEDKSLAREAIVSDVNAQLKSLPWWR